VSGQFGEFDVLKDVVTVFSNKNIHLPFLLLTFGCLVLPSFSLKFEEKRICIHAMNGAQFIRMNTSEDVERSELKWRMSERREL
jgi:hypothetical protein